MHVVQARKSRDEKRGTTIFCFDERQGIVRYGSMPNGTILSPKKSDTNGL